MGVSIASPLLGILGSWGIIDVDGIASMGFTVIHKLTYKDDDGATKPLNTGEKKLLKMFIVYSHRLSEDDVPLE
jgi:hypothetical protein